MCIAALKRIYTLLVMDMKLTWISHINMLASETKNIVLETLSKKSFSLTNRYDLTVIFHNYSLH